MQILYIYHNKIRKKPLWLLIVFVSITGHMLIGGMLTSFSYSFYIPFVLNKHFSWSDFFASWGDPNVHPWSVWAISSPAWTKLWQFSIEFNHSTWEY